MSSMFMKYCHAADVPVTCSIVLKADDKYVFNPGDKVEGTLIVSHQKDFVLHGFKVALEGTALTKYKEGESVQSKAEIFLNVFEYAYGGKVDGTVPQKYRLVGGATPHKYPFCLSLPLEPLPGSLKSSFGVIHYQVIAYMHMPPERFVKKAEKGFSLRGSFPLNESALRPMIIEKPKSDAPFRVKVTTAKTGYFPGESLDFSIELFNQKQVEVESMVASLVQKINFRTGNLSKILKTTFSTVSEIQTKETGNVWEDSIKIPSNQLLTNQKSIIEIQYIFKVDVNTKSGSGGIKGEIAITIGSPARRGGGGLAIAQGAGPSGLTSPGSSRGRAQ